MSVVLAPGQVQQIAKQSIRLERDEGVVIGNLIRIRPGAHSVTLTLDIYCGNIGVIAIHHLIHGLHHIVLYNGVAIEAACIPVSPDALSLRGCNSEDHIAGIGLAVLKQTKLRFKPVYGFIP